MHFTPRRTSLAAALAACLLSLPAAAQSLDAARSAARKALQGNPEVTSRLNAYLSKIDAQTAASAAWRPRFDLNADVGTNRVQIADARSSSVNRGGANLSLTQVLWDGYATRSEVNRSTHDRLGRWFDLVEASEQTSLEAVRAVYDVQRQRRLVALAEDNLAQHQQAAAKLESRFKAGVGRGVDLDQVRARVALAEVNRDTEMANLHDVAARYQRIVGERPGADMGSVELLKTGLPGTADEALKLALDRSAAIAAGIEGVRAARAMEEARRSAFQPQVSARAQVGAGKNLGGVIDRKTDAGVELLMNWNLYNGGADTARLNEQQRLVQQSMDLRDKACRDVGQTVLIAYNDAAKLTTQLASLARNAAAIEKARDAYRQQFDIGQRSLIDLLNAENESYTARRALTSAVYDRAVAYARTLAATTQLNVQLGIARELLPADAANWTAAGDGAGRCPAGAVDITPLRGFADLGTLMNNVLPAAPAVAQPVPAPAAPIASARPMERPARALAATAESTPVNNVQAWAKAWRNRDVSGLTNMYVPGFKGSSANATQWAAQMKRKLGVKGEIEMEVDDINVKDLGKGLVETQFQLTATVGNDIEVNDVALTWRQVDGEWRIVRERRL